MIRCAVDKANNVSITSAIVDILTAVLVLFAWIVIENRANKVCRVETFAAHLVLNDLLNL
jgi:hypothetical protein